MIQPLPLLTEDESRSRTAVDDDGFGALRTERGLLPLVAMDVRGRIDGLLSQVTVRQTFVNAIAEPLEATYIFPLPDRAAVTRFRMEVAGRVVEGELQERAQARREYDQAIEAGHRASIAEEERPGVFTLRVGNLPPGERATVELVLAGPLPFADGEVTFRFPMVVAPRYIPGVALSGPAVGDGTASDTDAVPDASRISPPVLLPGFPNPVRLSIGIDVHESAVPVEAIRSSLHAVAETQADGYRRITVKPGERLDRDFILRFRLATDAITTSLSIHHDPDGAEGTFAMTLVPPLRATRDAAKKPREVVFVLDRSGSMEGWKMVAARRAMARMLDTLGPADRFGVLVFDDGVETPPGFRSGELVQATDRNRFRAVEFLAGISARGGTEMAEPLKRASKLLEAGAADCDRILVLVTDGQVGNEDQLLRVLAPEAGGIRIFALGIDLAVNEAFLRRLADLGGPGGACEVVESEDRLDEVMDATHRRIGAPVLTGLTLEPGNLPLVGDTLVPGRIPDLFASAPVLLFGRYRGTFPDRVRLSARDGAGEPWSQEVTARVRGNPVVASVWARGQVRKLEDRYVAGQANLSALEREIVATSLRFGVLSRFTAYLAVDRSEVVNEGGEGRRITQPVEMPQGWEDHGGRGAFTGGHRRAQAMPTRARARIGFSAMDLDGAASAPPPPAPAQMETFQSIDMDALELLDHCLVAPPESFGKALRESGVAGGLAGDAVRQLAEECLTELRKGTSQGHDATVAVFKGLVPRLQPLLTSLQAQPGSQSGAKTLARLVKDLERLLNRAKLPAGDVSRLAARLESFLESLAATTGNPGVGAPKRREGFWK